MKALPILVAGVALAGPPAGRPPVGPLERYEPLRYAVQFEAQVRTRHQVQALERELFDMPAVPIAMPIILKSTFNQGDEKSLNARIWIEGREVPGVNQHAKLIEAGSLNTHLAILPMPEFRGFEFRWSLDQRIQVWNTRIPDERAMTELTWPREWPADVGSALQPQPWIESDAPIFSKAVKHVTNDRLRMVPPYLAAKELLRYCINEIQVNGDALRQGEQGELQGMVLHGARYCAEESMGTPNDLVCVCVAMLKAAGIPARPVIGIDYRDRKENRQGKLIAWGEFYIEGAGWVPFDPIEMRDEGVRHRDVATRWPGLGTFEHHNKRIPLSYQFHAPGTVPVCRYPAMWGIRMPNLRTGEVDQRIGFTVSELGPGRDD